MIFLDIHHHCYFTLLPVSVLTIFCFPKKTLFPKSLIRPLVSGYNPLYCLQSHILSMVAFCFPDFCSYSRLCTHI